MMARLSFLIVLVLGMTSVEANTMPKASDFGEMKTFLNANNYVYHLEEDLYVPGNILYSEYNVMKTSDGTGTPESIISGTLYTFSFVQLNSSSVILSMWNFHALKHLNRANKQLTMFAGGTAGFKDGSNGLFSGPRGLLHHEGKLYLADYNNKAVRVIDVNSRYVTTLYDGADITSPKALAMNRDTSKIFVSCTNKQIVSITRPGCGTPANVISSTSAIFKDPTEMIFLSNDVAVVAHDHRLIVYNFESEATIEICTNAASYTDGPIDTCTLYTPHGLLLKDSILYIGQYLRIRHIETPKAQNECALNLDDCTRNEDCTDTRYAWICTCKSGFEDETGCCVDIDECSSTPSKCDSGKKCYNTPGSHLCL